MKKLFFIAALTATSFGAFAQKDKEESKPLSFSVGLEGAFPLGTFGDQTSFGIGGSVQGDYKVADNVAITLNAGYISFSGKSYQVPTGINLTTGAIIYSSVKYNYSYIPVLVGLKYNFSKVYASGQVGMTFASVSNGGGSSSAFTYAPGIGYKFSSHIDALLKYVGYSVKGGSSSTVGLRLAYTL